MYFRFRKFWETVSNVYKTAETPFLRFNVTCYESNTTCIKYDTAFDVLYVNVCIH